MSLRSRFRLVVVSTVVLLTCIVVNMTLGVRHAGLHVRQAIELEGLVANLYDLRILNSDYIAAPSERVEQQWRSTHNRIKSKLVGQDHVPGEVKDSIDGLQQLFERLAAPAQNHPGADPSRKRLNKQLEAALNLESQRIIDWASGLSTQTQNDIVRHLFTFGTLMFAVILVIALMTITGMFLTARRTVLSVARLEEGTERIAGGELGFQVEQNGQDEFAALAAAVNRMSLDLKNSYQNLLEQTAQLQAEMAERQKAHEALRESEERYRSLFNSMTEGFALHVLLFDEQGQPCDYLFLSVNPAFERITGLKAQGLVGRTQRQVVPGEDTFWLTTYSKVALTGEPIHLEHYSQTLHRHFGVFAYCPAPNQFATIFSDITERRQAQAGLQKLEKLQSVGTLAGGIAHDFNNILLGLFGNISVAMDDLSKEHPSYAPLVEAEKSMSRAVRLTKQLLTFAKGGAPVKENVSLGDLAEEVARFDLSGSNVNLVYHQDEDAWPVDADKGQIQQVVSNLVINARQAMPNGGHLTLALENADLPEAAVPGLRQGRYVKVTVSDEGNGIDPKHLDRIFDPYFTTKQAGNGLGLATVWSIVTRHGGHIGVVSELGKGTTFTTYLPASASPLAARAKPLAAERPPAAPARPAKILVMDDEDTVCGLAERMLTRIGYAVATAPGGREAIALYRQAQDSGEPFDAVVMDLTIPGGIGGVETIKALLALDPGVRAIVSSGYADDPVMADPAAYGFKGAAAKPYTQSELREVVARVLAS